MARIGKRLREGYRCLEPGRSYQLEEAVALVKRCATARFDESVEISMNLGIDPRHADQAVRGALQLPHGSGKVLRIAVFAQGDKAEEARQAGADRVGAQDLADQIQGGWLDFDRCVATPDLMGVVGKLGKLLGPRGLMPNPKLGTVTADVASAVKDARAGSVHFRADKAGIVHSGIGKVSFSEAALVENARAFIEVIRRAKPSGAKGVYLRKISLSSSMGPGLAVSPVSGSGSRAS